jgi:tetratricopeptide (TPR) repeat protein
MTRYSLFACAGALMVSLALTGPALAAGSDSGDSGYESDTDSEAFQAGMEAADSGNWDLAITKFTVATTEDPSSADSFNMLAYSYRNKGDYDQAFRYYEKALTLDPEHANAHEYVGEAYLAVGDLPKAEEHLAALDDICWLGCEQYDDLEEAIEAYKSNN